MALLNAIDDLGESAGETVDAREPSSERRAPIYRIPQARYRPRPVASRKSSSATRFCAARGVTPSALPIMPAEMSGRESANAISAGSFEVERRPSSLRNKAARARSQRSCCFRPSSAAAMITSRLGDEPGGGVAASTALTRDGFGALGEAGQMRAGLAALAQQSGGKEAPETRRPLQRLDRAPGVVRERGGEGGGEFARPIDDFAPFGEARVLIPIEVIDKGIALARSGARRRPSPASVRSTRMARGVDRGDELGQSLVRFDRRREVFLLVPARLDVFEFGRRRPLP